MKSTENTESVYRLKRREPEDTTDDPSESEQPKQVKLEEPECRCTLSLVNRFSNANHCDWTTKRFRYYDMDEKKKNALTKEEFTVAFKAFLDSLEPNFDEQKIDGLLEEVWGEFHTDQRYDLMNFTEFENMVCFMVEEKGLDIRDVD